MEKPVDLVLVRHGESVANAANRRSEGGDHEGFTPEFCGNYKVWEMSREGHQQMERVKVWLDREFPDGFDSCVSSDYMRAAESAIICSRGWSQPLWRLEAALAERDWGPLTGLSEPLKHARFPRIMRFLAADPLRTDIPDVESFESICKRIAKETTNEADGQGVQHKLIVSHQEIMLGFRLIIERLSPKEFRAVYLAERKDKVQNGQVIHYSRCNPYTGSISADYQWVRMVRPAVSLEPFIPWTRIGSAMECRIGETERNTPPASICECAFACK